MKGGVDKSMGIVTLITETLAKIKPTVSLIFSKRAARKKGNYSDSSGDSPTKILVIDTTRSGNGDWKEDNGIRPIHV